MCLAFGVFGEDVDFDVDGCAGCQGVNGGSGVGVGDDGNGDDVIDQPGDGERDAVKGDGALGGNVAGELGGNLDTQAPVGGDEVGGVNGFEVDHSANSVDVALHDVATHRRAGGGRQLEVDGIA